MKILSGRFIITIIFVIGFIVFIFYLIQLSSNPKGIEKQLSEGYEGEIIDKYFQRTYHLKIRTENKIIDIAGLSDILDKLSQIGDSLIKYENSNCCSLVKEDTLMQMQYLYIPKSKLKRSEYLRDLNRVDCSAR